MFRKGLHRRFSETKNLLGLIMKFLKLNVIYNNDL